MHKQDKPLAGDFTPRRVYPSRASKLNFNMHLRGFCKAATSSMSSYFAIFFIIIIMIFLRSAHCTCMAASSSFPLEPSLLVPPREPLNSETVWQFSGLRYGTIGTNGTNGLMEVPDISLAFCKEVCFSTELNLGKQPWMTLIVCCIKP